MVPQKHIVIGGGSGFIGAALTEALRNRGDRVTWISRQAGEQRMTWEELEKGGLPDSDVIVNFAGQHILDMSRRWTCLLYTSPSPRDRTRSRMPSSA